MRAPISECSRIRAHSSSVSAAVFCSTSAGTPILPMSWTSPVRWTSSTCSCVSPISRAMSREYVATATEWPAVQVSRSSSAVTMAAAKLRLTACRCWFACSRRALVAVSSSISCRCLANMLWLRCAASSGMAKNASTIMPACAYA